MTYRRHQCHHHNQGAAFQNVNLFLAAYAIAASVALLGGSLLCQCEASNNNISSVAPESLMDEENADELPTPTQWHKYRKRKTMAKELTIEYG